MVVAEKIRTNVKPQLISTVEIASGYHTSFNIDSKQIDEDNWECHVLEFLGNYTFGDVVKLAYNLGDCTFNIDEWYEIAKYLNVMDYSVIVSAFVNAKYDMDKMQAIVNNKLLLIDSNTDNFEVQKEFEEMQQWRITAKTIANNILEKDEH